MRQRCPDIQKIFGNAYGENIVPYLDSSPFKYGCRGIWRNEGEASKKLKREKSLLAASKFW
jgi:hypothetical protein